MANIVKSVFEFFTLTEGQRQVVGEKTLDFGNIGSGALIFGSALAEGRIKWVYLFCGMFLWFVLFCVYLALTKSRGEK